MIDSLLNLADLDRYLPTQARVWIEQRFYAKINQQAVIDEAVKDPTLWVDTGNHVALFSDHGVVHVRDVMQQVLTVLDTINGVLMPQRDPEHLNNIMKGYGALVSLLHDIGMADFSKFGRAMHPEFAAQSVFAPEFDEWIDWVWQADCGQLRQTLMQFEAEGELLVPSQVALRELLALSMCHSKRKVPIHLLNHPAQLQPLLQRTIATDLRALYVQSDSPFSANAARFYIAQGFGRVAFAWLAPESPRLRQFRDDLLDVIRALRCADALRQRGTVLRTSAGYEMFVHQQTANLVVAMRDRNEDALLLELPDGGIGAGEANVASSEVGRDGHLRISFQRGSFATEDAFYKAVKDAAYVVHDIQSDVITSFNREQAFYPQINVYLESTDDNPDFVEAVRQQLTQMASEQAVTIEIVPSLRQASALERTRYLASVETDWPMAQRLDFLRRIAHAGQKIEGIDAAQAFRHTKLTHLKPNEVLITAGAPSGFVYFPLGEGLWVRPLGGYQPIAVRPWRPLGNTGVIRGADRNADIVARQDVQVLILPKDVYLRHWYRPFTVDELRTRMTPQT